MTNPAVHRVHKSTASRVRRFLTLALVVVLGWVGAAIAQNADRQPETDTQAHVELLGRHDLLLLAVAQGLSEPLAHTPGDLGRHVLAKIFEEMRTSADTGE